MSEVEGKDENRNDWWRVIISSSIACISFRITSGIAERWLIKPFAYGMAIFVTMLIAYWVALRS